MPAPGDAPEPPTGNGRRYARHVFVCTKGPHCPVDGPAEAVRGVLKSAVKQAGMKGAVRINQSGCLGQCGHGPMAVVYPEGVWYSHLDEASAKRIFVEHLQASRPVEELRYQTPHGGSCELPRRPDGSVDSEAHGYQACNRCPSGPATSS